jgi:S-DNA-T family DNA segregation ATPase FtsK/SpoIIIE
MNISPPDALVGAVALEYVLLKLRPQLEDDPEFRGAFHVLSGFSAEQLAGFIDASIAAGPRTSRLSIQFPEFELRSYEVGAQFTTSDSSVNVRNRERDGSVTLTAEVEADAEASLADSDRTDASDLKDKNIAHIWVDLVANRVGINLLPEDRRKAEAMVKGLFDTGRCPTAKAGDFLTAVLLNFKNGEPLIRAAGKALPTIGLPLCEDCFSSLNESKMVQAGQWAATFRSHYTLECYLDKRGPAQEMLDPELLRKRLSQLRSDDQQPPLTEELLSGFQDYIDSEGARNAATERLLFEFDWNQTTYCFDKAKKSTSKDFAERTRSALENEGINPTDDDILVIQALTKVARKPGSAADEFREFFERRTEQLETDVSLFVEWEEFVLGRRVECTDLFEGIFKCLHRSVRGLSATEEAYVVLEGKQQSKPNSFIEMSQRACEYFERAYGALEAKTKKKIRFKQTLICNYSQAVLPKIKDKPKFKGTSKTGKATTLNFLVSIYQKQRGDAERKVATISLAWRFPVASVLAQEVLDFDAISRYHAHRGTALVGCIAEYEVVGRKGTPVTLSLQNVEGFADAARGGGRGAFVPAQDRIESLSALWRQAQSNAQAQLWIPPEELSELSAGFADFELAYNAAVLALRKSALEAGGVAGVSASYRSLLLKINGLRHQDARRQFLRIIMRVGLAQVPRSGRRPPMAVVCPWHPLRMEAVAARQLQIMRLIDQLLGKDRPPFSDGTSGALFFREVEQLLSHPLYPEMTVIWEGTQAMPRIASQAFDGYTLQPPEPSNDAAMPSLDDESTPAAATIEHEMTEYLRLQPHERDNFSILLYNCDSPDLPTAVVETINRINSKREDNKITCQVLLMHRDDVHLRQIYRDLVARGVDAEADPSEGSGDFLAKVRVNITAANRLRRDGRSQPVDIAYCRDLISREAKPAWEWLPRETAEPADLQPHQWSRRLPVSEGDRKVRLQLSCPAQTETGWAYLYSVAALCAHGADDAWKIGKCPVLMRCLDFDDLSVDRIFRETHELATWVVNQDELLDRKLLEARQVKVIRYVQSATHGRNLIISSSARETLLVNTLKEKLRLLLASDTPDEVIDTLWQRFIHDANKVSGGLVLRAARRANNTNELLGMVLSRYLVQSEIGLERPIAWCFLDDYSEWLGKKEGANIADLLVLAPTVRGDGTMHLDIIVTEAKFVTHDAMGGAANTSAKQLVDTLSQITEAMDGETKTIDQDIWLARLSDLVASQTAVAPGRPQLDSVAWRRAIRQRQCSVSIWGYSHIFVHEPQDLTAQVSTVKGIINTKGAAKLDALQEVFGPGHVRELINHYYASAFHSTAELRLRNGHPAFGKSRLYSLTGKAENNVLTLDGESVPEDQAEVAKIQPPVGRPDAEIEPGSGSTANVVVDGVPEMSPVEAYLQEQSALHISSEEAGQVWLGSITTQLRQALISRGLPARLAEAGGGPILTPNSGIIKLQGSKDLTVQAVESRANELYTSEGIKIIHATPESGRVSIAVERPNRQILYTEPVLLDYLRNYRQQGMGEKLCVGIREEDGKALLLDPLNQPHTLIAGITGSGKSVLMQNLILSIAATRSPSEAHIYLIDPKFGVDYRPLDELPHVEVGSGGIIDDPHAAIKVLEGLVDEMNRRYELFKATKVPNVHAYRRATGLQLPILWVVHDEFADWMQTDDYRNAVPNIVGRLSVKARAAGIFLLFAAQRPDKDVMPMQLRSQLGNRLILKVDNAATAEIAMGSKNSGAERLLGRGHMLAKTGDTPEAVFAQVPFIDIEHTIPQLVRLIRVEHGRPLEMPR